MTTNNISLCIPRVFFNIDETRIRDIFNELDLGEIDRIDILKTSAPANSNSNSKSKSTKKFNTVFIHFKKWFDSENANSARERFQNGKEIKIIYDEPWFWKVSEYRRKQAKHDHPSPN
jgi:hypothetical protein